MKRNIAILTLLLLLTGCSSQAAESLTTSGTSPEQTAQESISPPEQTSSEASAEISLPTAEPPSTEPTVTPEPDTTGETSEDVSIPVKAHYLEDVPELAEHDEFNVTEDSSVVKVVFTADSAVTDFRVLSIAMQDYDDSSGKTTFAAEEMYSQSELTPERPLEAGLVFLGDIPNNGISFTGADGVVKYYAVDMSGRDGSLFLWEISVV